VTTSAAPGPALGIAAFAVDATGARSVSDNDAIALLWSRVGGERLLAMVNEHAGVQWRTDDGDEHPSLRVLVTAAELARAYGTFVADDRDVATMVRAWMYAVPAAQTFGTRQIACEKLGVTEAVVAVKCGWFGCERFHAVTLVDLGDRTVGAAVMTFRPPDATSRASSHAAHGNDEQIVAAHDALCGPSVREGTRRALQVAVAL
jgi:hypothetical protein